MVRPRWRWFVRHVVRRPAADTELDAEIRAHLALETERRVDAGESPDDARRMASRDFGNFLLVMEVTRDMWGWGFVERWARSSGTPAKPLFILSSECGHALAAWAKSLPHMTLSTPTDWRVLTPTGSYRNPQRQFSRR